MESKNLSNNEDVLLKDITPREIISIVQETEILVNDMLSKHNIYDSCKYIIASLEGRWVFPTNTGWYIIASSFSGSVMNTDSLGSWFASGSSSAKSSQSRPFELPWALEYDQSTDALTWITWGQIQIFKNASKPESPIFIGFNRDKPELNIFVKTTVPFGTVNIAQSSYLKAVL